MGVVAHGAPVFKIGGDPGGISTRAAVMMDRANEFRDIHSGLSSLKADGWEGRAADHFRSKFDVQVKGWVDAQEAFSEASEAYSSYASTLASAQSQCDGIRSRWKAGRDAVQQAQNNQADARSQAAADGGSPVFDASCDEGPGRSAMAAAVADFQTLVDQVNEAGDLLITALNAGISKLPERTWWDSAKRTVGSILGGAYEAVVELVKLVWKLGGQEFIWDFGRMLMGDMTLDEFTIKHVEMPIETVTTMAKALWQDPVGFMKAVGKSLIDWDTWTDDPARAIGHLLPDIAIALATMGGSAGVSAGEKALTGGARALRIGKEVFKAILPISPDDVRSLAKLGKNLVGKLSARGINTAADLADLANTAQRLTKAADHAHDLGHAANGMADALDGAADAGRAATRAGGAIGDTSHAAHAAGGAADAAGSASHAAHAASGGGGIASSASHAANGAGSASHAAHAGGNAADAAGSASHAAHAGGNAADAAGSASHASHTAGNTADAAGNASHASHGGADVKDSALPPTDPGHRSNGVSSAAQPDATPHAPAAGDASTGGHAAPANTAPSASNGAHNNAFMNADTGGATHGAGSTANGATGAPATGAGTHGAPAAGAPATGTHGAGTTGAPSTGAGTHGAPATGAPATGAPATGSHGAGASGAPAAPGAPSSGSHGAASGHGAAGGSPAAPVRNDGVGERGAPAEAIAQKKPVDPDKVFTRSGNDFGAPANKIDTHAGGNQKSLDHVDVKPGDSDKVPNGQYHPVETAGGPHRGGTDGALKGDDFEPKHAVAGDGKPPRKPNDSWDSDGFSANRDDYDLFGVENRKDSSYLDHSSTHANGETRGADELVGAGVGRSEASVGAQGSYERAGAFGGSDPSRVSHGADGFGGTADFGANAGHAGHGAHGVSNSADVGGGVGDASRGTHAAGAPTGQGGGHVGADTGTHGGSSAPAQGPHRGDPGMSTGDTHGVSRADSTPGHGDTPRAGHGGDGAPDAPTTPKKDTPAGDGLVGDKQPHSGKHAADTPATHADEAADASKAGHDSGDANGSGKADADAQHGHDSGEHAAAEPKAKDHSANGKADDAADSTSHGDKTEADKPTSDKSHKEDDAAHHDGDEHPKDTDDKHSAKTDDADSKSPKDEADTHKSDKDGDAKSDKDNTDAKSDKDNTDGKSDKDDTDGKSDDDNGGGESDNDTVSDKNPEESQEIKSEEGTGEEKRNPHSGDPDHNWGTYVDENGVPHIDPSDPRPYLNPKNRPSLKEQTILDVWNEEVRPDGTVVDPAGRVIEWTPGTSRRGVWDMGHIPGEKYHDRWLEYVNGEMTPAEFREWYNTAEHYRVEHPTTNRSHKYEGLDK